VTSIDEVEDLMNDNDNAMVDQSSPYSESTNTIIGYIEELVFTENFEKKCNDLNQNYAKLFNNLPNTTTDLTSQQHEAFQTYSTQLKQILETLIQSRDSSMKHFNIQTFLTEIQRERNAFKSQSTNKNDEKSGQDDELDDENSIIELIESLYNVQVFARLMNENYHSKSITS
jgi:hypothetical protein